MSLIRNHRSLHWWTPAFALLAVIPLGVGAAETGGAPCRSIQVHLRAAVFDPLTGPGQIPEELRLPPDADTESWIVQFRAPLTRQQRQLLTAENGLKLTLYIPDCAYLERIAADRLKRLRELSFLRAALPYQPAFKISPGIGKLEFRTPERQGMTGLLLNAILFDDADPGSVAADLEAIPGVCHVEVRDFRGAGGAARIEFGLASEEALPAVARLEAVRWIEEIAEPDEDVREESPARRELRGCARAPAPP